MKELNEIRQILGDMGGEVQLKTKLIVKMSPHSSPTVLRKISIDNLNFPLPVLQTILQRLKLINHFGQ